MVNSGMYKCRHVHIVSVRLLGQLCLPHRECGSQGCSELALALLEMVRQVWSGE